MTPPNGWRFKNQSSGQWIIANHKKGLVEKVIFHRQQIDSGESLDPEIVGQEIDEQICLMLDDSWCKGDSGREVYSDVTKSLSTAQFKSLATATTGWLKGGAELVSKEVLSERQSICNTCPMNKHTNACACFPIYKAIERVVPQDRRNDNLGVCSICGCLINAKAQLKDEVIQASNKSSNPKFPSWCWQNKAEPNKTEIFTHDEPEPKPEPIQPADETAKPIELENQEEIPKPRAKKKATRAKKKTARAKKKSVRKPNHE